VIFHVLYNRSDDTKNCDFPDSQASRPIREIGRKVRFYLRVIARGEEQPDSDIDILVEFRGHATFDRYTDTKFYLEELLGRKVDLVTPKAIKPRMKPCIMQDFIHVA
jgi:hypothetical protein